MSIPLGPFDLLQPVARGGMGVVWRGRHRQQGLPVAVKVLGGGQSSPRERAVFEFEVRSTARLHHPGVIYLLDYGHIPETTTRASEGLLEPDSPYLVMEWLSGGSLSEREITSWEALLDVLLRLLDALAHAHARGVLHRDIKPGNVMFATDEDIRPGVRLVDFGLAAASRFDPDSHEPLYGGTPAYTAPEQVTRSGVREQGPWTDIYGVACLAYRLACGKPPFTGDADAVIDQQLIDPLPEIEPVFDVPRGLDDWIQQATQKAPRDRFISAAEAGVALARLDAGLYGTRPSLDVDLPSSGGAPREETSSTVPTDLITLRVGAGANRGDADRADPVVSGEVALASGARLRMPVPRKWHTGLLLPPPVRLVDAGLGLFGLRAPPFSGRIAAREILWARVHDAFTAGRSQQITIRGDRGTGKSRVMDWLGRRVHELGLGAVLEIGFDEASGLAGGLGRFFERICNGQALGRTEVADRLYAHLGELTALPEKKAEEIVALFGSDMLETIDASDLVELLVAYLGARAAQRPVLLLVDDAQWAQGIEALAPRVEAEAAERPIVALYATRSGPAIGTGALSRHLTLDLEPLHDTDIEALLQELIRMSPDLAAQVVGRAEGNPLFAIQIVTDWVRRGRVRATERGFDLIDGEDPVLPDDVRRIWAERIERFVGDGPEALALRDALEIAATFGADVNASAWREACRAADVEVPPRTRATMLRSGLIMDSAAGFRFSHGLLREALVQQAERAGRSQKWHRACARAIQMNDRHGTSGSWEHLAFHLIVAGESAEAIEPLLRSASASNRAPHLFDRCEGLLDEVGVPPVDRRRARLKLERAKWNHNVADYDASDALVSDVLSLSEHDTWADLRADAERIASHNDLARERFEDARDHLQVAIDLYRELGDDAGLLKCQLTNGQVARRLGQLEDAERILEDVALRSAETGDERTQTAALRALGDLYRNAKKNTGAQRTYEQAIALAEKIGDDVRIAKAHNDYADLLRLRGDLTLAEEHYGYALAAFERIGSIRGHGIALANIGLLHADRGEWEQANEVLGAAIETLSTNQDRIVRAVRLLHLRVLAALDDWHEWDTTWRITIEEDRSPISVDRELADGLHQAGELARRSGEHTRAANALRRSADLFDALGDPERSLEIRAAIADLS